MRTTRQTKPQPPADIPGNSLVASATRLSGSTSTDFSRTAKIASQEWQRLAWGFYRSVGEYRFACDWVGSMLSKAVLFAQEEGRNGRKPVKSGPAVEILSAFAGDGDGQADVLRAIGVHFTVAGECYLVGATDEDGEDEYNVYAATAITKRAGKWYINGREIKGDPWVIRMWRPDPVDPTIAHSPSRAMLPILAEIDGLTKHVAAQIDSRLAGAGMLLLPNEMTFPTKPVINPDGTYTTTVSSDPNHLIAVLQDTMATAIANREDPSALVPIILQMPGEMISNVQHLTFWTDFDQKSVELRNEAIRRLALGMDMPPEVLLGVADTNHWAAWAADESAIKAHTEPLLKIVTRSLTVGFLRPLLRKETPDAAQFSIGADTSLMRLRPNRSKEALELWQQGELSAAAMRRENGFDEADAPKDDEIAAWLTRKIASGSTTPEQVAAAARMLGVDLPEETAGVEPTEARPDPSLLDHPVAELPEEAAATIRLEAASEQMVFRALERCGNRMKQRGSKPPGVAAADIYRYVDADPGNLDHYLEDAFTGVSRFAPSLGMDPGRLEKCLSTYVRMLVSERKEHDPKVLSAWLGLARVA